MLGISLYNYLYLKLAKVHGGTGSTQKWFVCGVIGEVVKTMYTHVSK
jgi:hypothetical protein